MNNNGGTALYVDGDAHEEVGEENVEVQPIDVKEFVCLMKNNIQITPPVLSEDVRVVPVALANVNSREHRRDFLRAQIPSREDHQGAPTILSLTVATAGENVGLFAFAVMLVVACHVLKRPLYVFIPDREMMVGPAFRLRAAYRRLLTTQLASRSRISIADFLEDFHDLAEIIRAP